MNLLEIKNLTVNVLNKQILSDLSLNIGCGETHVLMGRNGSGKSTLVNTLMGHENYKVEQGSLVFDNKIINDLTTDERANLGIYLCMQNPPVIEGLSTAELMRNTVSRKTDNFKLFAFVKELNENNNIVGLTEEMLHRSVNEGFSGGERKKNEVMQILMLKPKLIILDEIDSGVDVDSLKVIAEVIKDYKAKNSDVAILIITHHSHILKYLEPDHVHIINQGKLIKSGDINLVHEVEKSGFEKTVNCAVKEWMNHE